MWHRRVLRNTWNSRSSKQERCAFKNFFIIIKNDENKKANLCAPTLALSASPASKRISHKFIKTFSFALFFLPTPARKSRPYFNFHLNIIFLTKQCEGKSPPSSHIIFQRSGSGYKLNNNWRWKLNKKTFLRVLCAL